jgi:predicted enzyme related to lactoylglutathione lyase
MTIHPRFGFALEYVPDVETAKQFYVDVLGLQVQRCHPVFVQFQNFAIASDESMGGKGKPIREMPFGKVFTINDPAGRPRFLIELAKERPSQAV